MSTQIRYLYRVLIVDDEIRDWALPMKRALEDIARENGIIGNLMIDVAEDKRQAEKFLAQYNYHLTSLDMRLPELKGELLSVEPGLSLAKGFPWIGFPKLLIYSQTLRVEEFIKNPNDSMLVLQVPTDQYAKPTGGDADQEEKGVESLTVKAWAKRVFESLLSDEIKFTANTYYGKRLTVVGAYLHYGVNAIPPFLASLLQTVENQWTEQTRDRVETAFAFIEATARLAFAQSAVLYQAQGGDPKIPESDRLETCLNDLEILRKRLSCWNWCNYLTKETLLAFQQARRDRNSMVHSVEVYDSQKWWTIFSSHLKYAMDLAAYWVRHPLTVDLRFNRDGWSAELLAGTTNPRPRHQLPQAMVFPTEAVRNGVWQSVWRLPGEGFGEPERIALSWEKWLILSKNSSTQWWFPIYQRGRRKICIDLVSGRSEPQT